MNDSASRASLEAKTKNTLFPTRPDYVGPTQGWFLQFYYGKSRVRSYDVLPGYITHPQPDYSDQWLKWVFGDDFVRVPAAPDPEWQRAVIYLGGCDAVAELEALMARIETLQNDLYSKYEAQLDESYNEFRKTLAQDRVVWPRYFKADHLFDEYGSKLAVLDSACRAERDALYLDVWTGLDRIEDGIWEYVGALDWNGSPPPCGSIELDRYAQSRV